MSDLDQLFCTKLVEAVEKHPCLYDYSLADYSNKILVENAWEMAAEEVDSSVAICKEKWRNIRTVYSRSLKPCHSGRKRKKPYYLNEMLQFLLPFLKPSVSGIKENLASTLKEQSETTTLDIDEQEHRDIYEPSIELSSTNTTSSSETSHPTSTPNIKSQDRFAFVKPDIKNTANRAKSQQNISATDKSIIDFCNRQSAATLTEDNPRKLFLVSLLSDVESMTDQQFRKFRMKVLPLIDGILSEQPTSSGSSIGTPAQSSSPPSKR